ncbi:MAG: hypothetical protein AAGA48_35800 [Myxococcota bacterium]
MQSTGPNLQFAFPRPEGWQRNLLILLLALYVVELVVAYANIGVDLGTFVWQPLGLAEQEGFRFWQLVSRFFVHTTATGVFSVVFSMIVLWFFLPAVGEVLDWDSVGQAIIAAAVVGTVLPFGLDVAGVLDGRTPAGGWENLVLTLPILFGLARPDRQILIFVLPAPAKVFVWGSLALAALGFIGGQTLGTAEMLGVWLGTFGWWHLVGPGQKRREWRRKGASIEREIRLTVLEGGRANDGDNHDDTVH